MKITAGLWFAICFITLVTGGLFPAIVVGALALSLGVAADHAGTVRNEIGGSSSYKQLR